MILKSVPSMPEKPSLNPYEPPPSDADALAVKPLPKFRPIFRQWRPLRLKYNLILFVIGLLASFRLWLDFEPFLIPLILVYAAFANLFFTLGVVPEVIIAFITRENDHPNLRKVVFILGLLFSIIVTLIIGFEI
ncbi:MAG: hypothetical protein ACJAQT_002062 [Akkermansiaceae bacterium]|jgi:hypothetical protein